MYIAGFLLKWLCLHYWSSFFRSLHLFSKSENDFLTVGTGLTWWRPDEKQYYLRPFFIHSRNKCRFWSVTRLPDSRSMSSVGITQNRFFFQKRDALIRTGDEQLHLRLKHKNKSSLTGLTCLIITIKVVGKCCKH